MVIMMIARLGEGTVIELDKKRHREEDPSSDVHDDAH
jgi:hypothetical protein